MTGLVLPDDTPSLASRLNWLFTLTSASSSAVAQTISRDPGAGVTLSKSYLTALRSGRQTNPTVSVISALVHYFNAEIDDLQIDTDWLIDGTVRSPRSAAEEVEFIAARAGRLPAELRQDLIRQIQAYRG